jgi:hypothetical protein
MAGVTLQTFDQSGCLGNIVQTITQNSASQFNSSGCTAITTQNPSIGIVGQTSGFQCNLYTDTACQDYNSVAIFTVENQCTDPDQAIQSIICLDEAASVAALGATVTAGVTEAVSVAQAIEAALNPFFNSTALVTTGKSQITVDDGGLVQRGVQLSCSENGCDPTTLSTSPFQHFGKECTLSVEMEGTYSGTQERDYMQGLLSSIEAMSRTNGRLDDTGSATDDDTVFDIPSFFSVQMDLPDGANQASMSAQIKVDCLTPAAGACNLAEDVAVAALKAVPDVGSIFAPAFQFAVCGGTE